MSRRLAGYAAEIERYLHGMPVVRDDPDDDDRTASARREAGEFQAMRIYERAGGSGRAGGVQAGSGSGGSASPAARGHTGAPGARVASSRTPRPTAGSASPKAASAPIMIYTATLAGFQPAEEVASAGPCAGRLRRGDGGDW